MGRFYGGTWCEGGSLGGQTRMRVCVRFGLHPFPTPCLPVCFRKCWCMHVCVYVSCAVCFQCLPHTHRHMAHTLTLAHTRPLSTVLTHTNTATLLMLHHHASTMTPVCGLVMRQSRAAVGTTTRSRTHRGKTVKVMFSLTSWRRAMREISARGSTTHWHRIILPTR